MRFEEGLGQVPAAILFCDDIFLIALMRGAAIAEEDSSVGLDFASGAQACAGDGDEGVAGSDDTANPAVEAESVPGVQLRRETLAVEAGAVEQIVGCVKERKGADERTRQAFALQSCPGPSGVDLLEMVASMELMCKFEVVEDSKDGLSDFHRRGYALESC